MVTVEIICFGNELLIGKTVNTNAHWLGNEITRLGSTVTRITSVPDNLDDMVLIIKEALARKPAFIITTGGMGTTFDDMAVAALAKALQLELVLDQKALQLLKERLAYLRKARKVELELTENRKRMAYMPKGATPLKNRAGSAPGVFIETEATKIFTLPGVPQEMKAIFEFEVFNHFPRDPNQLFYEESILVNNIPESELAAKISTVREKYEKVYFKTHPRTSSTSKEGIIEVEVHLTAICSEEEMSKLTQAMSEVKEVIGAMKGAKGLKPIISELQNTEEEKKENTSK